MITMMLLVLVVIAMSCCHQKYAGNCECCYDHHGVMNFLSFICATLSCVRLHGSGF